MRFLSKIIPLLLVYCLLTIHSFQISQDSPRRQVLHPKKLIYISKTESTEIGVMAIGRDNSDSVLPKLPPLLSKKDVDSRLSEINDIRIPEFGTTSTRDVILNVATTIGGAFGGLVLGGMFEGFATELLGSALATWLPTIGLLLIGGGTFYTVAYLEGSPAYNVSREYVGKPTLNLAFTASDAINEKIAEEQLKVVTKLEETKEKVLEKPLQISREVATVAAEIGKTVGEKIEKTVDSISVLPEVSNTIISETSTKITLTTLEVGGGITSRIGRVASGVKRRVVGTTQAVISIPSKIGNFFRRPEDPNEKKDNEEKDDKEKEIKKEKPLIVVKKATPPPVQPPPVTVVVETPVIKQTTYIMDSVTVKVPNPIIIEKASVPTPKVEKKKPQTMQEFWASVLVERNSTRAKSIKTEQKTEVSKPLPKIEIPKIEIPKIDLSKTVTLESSQAIQEKASQLTSAAVNEIENIASEAALSLKATISEVKSLIPEIKNIIPFPADTATSAPSVAAQDDVNSPKKIAAGSSSVASLVKESSEDKVSPTSSTNSSPEVKLPFDFSAIAEVFQPKTKLVSTLRPTTSVSSSVPVKPAKEVSSSEEKPIETKKSVVTSTPFSFAFNLSPPKSSVEIPRPDVVVEVPKAEASPKPQAKIATNPFSFSFQTPKVSQIKEEPAITLDKKATKSTYVYKYPFQSSTSTASITPEALVQSSKFKGSFLTDQTATAIAKYFTKDGSKFPPAAKKIDDNLGLVSANKLSAADFYDVIVATLGSKEAANFVYPYTIGCLPRGTVKTQLSEFFRQKPE